MDRHRSRNRRLSSRPTHRFHMIHTTIPGELDVMGVSLLTGALPPTIARPLEALVLIIAAGLCAFATWSSWLQAWDSWVYDSVSFGMVRVPLWLPQGVMTLGLVLLCIALIDSLVTVIRGGTPHYAEHEQGEA